MIEHENKLTCPLNSSYLSSSITQQSPNLVPENREFTVNIAIRNKPVQPEVHFILLVQPAVHFILLVQPAVNFLYYGP